eukprot:m.36605 g.36605  ORF g.36605 m.36605 type:complete len:662 (-) comp7591_c0_seq1:187-2172(-)
MAALRSAVLATVCGLSLGQTAPQIITDATNNIRINTAGDLLLATGGSTCTSAAPCAVGASLSTVQSTTEALSNAIPATYLTTAAASSTFATQASLSNYVTISDGNAMDASTRTYIDNEILALANLTGNFNAMSGIINAHQRLGVLDAQGRFTGDIRISGDAQLATMLELLDHVTAISGSLYISSLSSTAQFPSDLFARLTTVGLDVTFQSCNGLTSLAGVLPSLTGVGRNLIVQSSGLLTNMTNFAPALTTVNGSVWIRYNQQLSTLNGSLPMLNTIGSSLQIASNSPNMPASLGTAMPQLSNLGGANLNIPGLPPFDAGTMIYTGTLRGTTFASIAAAAGTARIIAGNVYIQSVTDTSVPTNFLSNVRVISGIVYIQRNTQLTSLTNLFNNLQSAGGIYIYLNSGMTSLGNCFQSLTTVNGYLQVRNQQNSQFTSLNGIFPQLTNVTSYVYIQYNYNVRSMTGAFPRLTWVNSQIYISYNRALASLDNTAFPLLQYTGGITITRNNYGSAGLRTINGIFPSLLRVGTSGLYITYEYRLLSGTNMFPQLVQVGASMYFYYNTVATTITGSFPNLVSIRYVLYMYNNYQLTGVSNIYSRLTTIGSTLSFYRNGCSSSTGSCLQAFCTAVQARLCPAATVLATRRYAYDANNCCTAFCQSNTC